jgi:hypothetical protein
MNSQDSGVSVMKSTFSRQDTIPFVPIEIGVLVQFISARHRENAKDIMYNARVCAMSNNAEPSRYELISAGNFRSAALETLKNVSFTNYHVERQLGQC